MIHFENHVLLHQCSSHLLKKKKTIDNIPFNECRLNYILYLKNAKAITDGKQACKVPALVACKYPTYPEGEQYHLQTVQGYAYQDRRLETNMDFQPVFGLQDDITAVPDGQNWLEYINDM